MSAQNCPEVWDETLARYFLVTLHVHVTTNSLLGSVVVTFRWDDELYGSRVETHTVLLTILNTDSSRQFPMLLNENTIPTIETAVVGVTGSPVYDVAAGFARLFF